MVYSIHHRIVVCRVWQFYQCAFRNLKRQKEYLHRNVKKERTHEAGTAKSICRKSNRMNVTPKTRCDQHNEENQRAEGTTDSYVP